MSSGVDAAGLPSPELIAELAARVDAAATDALTSSELLEAFRLSEEERTEPAGFVHTAFEYRESANGDDGYFGPMFAIDGQRHPPALKAVEPAGWALWEAVADAVASPIARARLHDLCFEGHHGHGGDHGRAAAESYLEMSDFDLTGLDDNRRPRVAMERTFALGRALALSRKLGDPELADRPAAAIVDATTESLASGRREPGVTLELIDALIAADRPEADALLKQARERYAGDAWNTDAVIQMQLRRVAGDDELRTKLQRERVATWLDHAEQSDALLRMHFLEGAVILARDYGFTDLVDEITTRLQTIQFEDLGLKRFSYEISIPAEAVEEYVARFTGADSWQDALRLLTMDAPSGDVIANRKTAEDLRAAAPMREVMPETIVGADGLPRLTVTTEEQKREKRLVEVEAMSINTYAGVVQLTLTRIWEKWGPIAEDDLAAFLSERDHMRAPLARALARAFLRFFDGDFEGAVFTATPRVETLVRELALAGDSPIYKAQRASSPGQYPGLGAMLPELRNRGVDESWTRYLNTLLAHQMGPNYRNDLLHGFKDDPPDTLAGLVLVGALFLAVRVAVGPPPEYTQAVETVPSCCATGTTRGAVPEGDAARVNLEGREGI